MTGPGVTQHALSAALSHSVLTLRGRAIHRGEGRGRYPGAWGAKGREDRELDENLDASPFNRVPVASYRGSSSLRLCRCPCNGLISRMISYVWGIPWLRCALIEQRFALF